MGCSSCGGNANVSQMSKAINKQTYTSEMQTEDCSYTVDQLSIWKDKLNCFKEKGLYIQYNILPADLNRSIGIVLSALNYPSNTCHFKNELDSVFDTITLIVSTNKC